MMYTAVWTSADGFHVSTMNKHELSNMLNEGEFSEVEWLGNPDLFNWHESNKGFIIKGDSVIPVEKQITKMVLP